MAIIDIKNCVFRIEDGSTNRISIKMGEGTLSWTETINREYLMDRGIIDTVRDGDQVPLEVSFTARYEYLKSSTATPSIEEALRQRGAASAWVNAATDVCTPYCVDLVFVHTPLCTDVIERVTLPDFRVEKLDHDVKAGTISFNGKCNVVAPIIARGNQYT